MSENVENIWQSHKFHHKSHEKLESGNFSRRKTQAEEKIQWDLLSPLLFVIAIMSLNYIYRNFTGSNKFTKLRVNINHLYMDVLFAKNEKITGEPNTNNKNIRNDIATEFDIENVPFS